MATATYATGGRAMTIGSTLSRAFSAIGNAPVVFLGTSFVLTALPMMLSQAITRTATPTALVPGANPFGAILPTAIAMSVVWFLLYMLAQAMLFRATVAELDRRPGTLGDYAAAAARATLPLAGLAVLMSLAVWIGILLLFVPGVMLAIMWSVAAPALVIERTGVMGAFGRSRSLTSGARWRIFGLVVLVFAIYLVAGAVLGVGSIAAGFAAARGGVPTTPTLLSTIVSIVLQTAFVAIWTAVQATLFVDLREWKDGPATGRLADIFS